MSYDDDIGAVLYIWVTECDFLYDTDDSDDDLTLYIYIYEGNAISALRMLQKERLVVSRLGNDICAVECIWVINCDYWCDINLCHDDDD